jgi:hypothetical protein
VSFGPRFWRDALAAPPAQPGPGPYGPLLGPDANGIMLPRGFTSRVIARAGQVVPGTAYVFPAAPDGQATYPLPDGGWVLVTNTEVPVIGGVSAIRFDKRGTIGAAYRILENTSVNCAGGPTPWGTWLSCEEVDRGLVWECDPTGAHPGVSHPSMGVFKHEAACVDPLNGHVFLSEDVGDGGFYRYVPTDYPDLSAGELQIACDGTAGLITWRPLPDPRFSGPAPLRQQIPDALKFARGEGIWYDAGRVYLATTTDETIHVYDTETETIDVLYRAAEAPGTPLRGIDNLHVSRSGDLFVAEDSYTGDPDAMDVCIITRERQVARFLKLTGDAHFVPNQSETTGITFDPSGTRMYLGSQRYLGTGIVYEVSGPFRQGRGTAPERVPSSVAGLGTGTGAPGLPIGIEVPRRISLASLLRRGLAVGLTLDAQATVRVRLTARLGRRRRTVTLASVTRRPNQGHTTLRVKPSKARAKLVRGRRQSLPARIEVRITTPGAPVRVLRGDVRVLPRE